MKIIYTNKNEPIFVDDEDYEWLNQYTWCLHGGYAVSSIFNRKGDGNYDYCRMHRMILNPDANLFVDHINHVKHDNRKENLRTCTPRENMMNSSLAKNNTSGVTGVHWHKTAKKWITNISVDHKLIHLGYFTVFEEAVRVRMLAEIKYFGEFRNKYIETNIENIEKSIKKPQHKRPTRSASGIKGVGWSDKYQKWTAYIVIKCNKKQLGMYSNIHDAIKKRKDAEIEYFNDHSDIYSQITKEKLKDLEKIKTNEPQLRLMQSDIINKTDVVRKQGVSWDRTREKWVVSIQVNCKRKHIGAFENLEDANKAREDAELKYAS